MILFFDTETTGFLDDRLPIDHEAQPYIVQLAAQPVAGFCLIVAPGVAIPPRAAAVHGITDEKAIQFGVSAEFALSAFTHLYQRSDLICAHNIKFDKGIVEVAIARHYGKTMPLRKPLFCTMEAASPIIKLPPTEKMRAAGFDKPKPPKLEECVQHFFNETLDGAHDAMVDLVACRRVYLHLKSIKDSADGI
jgi:DNA polymerase-3 subunit epsilon